MEALMSVSEVAAVCGVPVKTVEQWRYRKIGPKGFRLGRHVRYRPEDVQAWIDAQQAGSTSD
jgi:excisionase family DNA binding protein